MHESYIIPGALNKAVAAPEARVTRCETRK